MGLLLLCTVVGLAVGIAVAVAITVTVAVAVAAVGTLGAVEDDGEVLETLLVVDLLKLGKHGAVEQAGADDEERAVGCLLQYLGVGDDVDGGTVDEDVVVGIAHLGDKSLKPAVLKEFGGVGRYLAYGQDMEVGMALEGNYKPAPVVVDAAEIVADA